MKNLLIKECRLFASPLTYIFIAFSLMTMVPGYPILMGAFFVCLGLFQSFQQGIADNDVLYTALLPIRKKDAVRSKFLFVCAVQLTVFVIMAALTAVRMTVLSDAEIYAHNALMNATPLFLAFILLIFAAFNCVFVAGFFKTAYKTGAPYIKFVIVAVVLVGTGEAIHAFPGMRFFNDPAGARLPLQFALLGAAAVIYALATLAACRISEKRFEKIDL